MPFYLFLFSIPPLNENDNTAIQRATPPASATQSPQQTALASDTTTNLLEQPAGGSFKDNINYFTKTIQLFHHLVLYHTRHHIVIFGDKSLKKKNLLLL